MLSTMTIEVLLLELRTKVAALEKRVEELEKPKESMYDPLYDPTPPPNPHYLDRPQSYFPHPSDFDDNKR